MLVENQGVFDRVTRGAGCEELDHRQGWKGPLRQVRDVAGEAERLGRENGIAPGAPPDALAPDRSVDDLLEVCRFPKSREAVLVVGHQPTLGLALARVLGADGAAQGPWSVRKGAFWWLRWREREGAAQITVQAVLGPDTV